MSVDIKLDPTTHDIDFTKGGELNKEVEESLSQKVKIALLLRTTEWGPNINAGVPYSQSIFRGKNNKTFVDSYLQGYILRIPEVGRLTSFTSSIDNDRRYNMKFTAIAEQQTTRIEVIL